MRGNRPYIVAPQYLGFSLHKITSYPQIVGKFEVGILDENQ